MTKGLLEGVFGLEMDKNNIQPDPVEDAGKYDEGDISDQMNDQVDDQKQQADDPAGEAAEEALEKTPEEAPEEALEKTPEVTPEVTPEEQENDISGDVPVSGSTIVYEGDTVVTAVTEVRPILSTPINDYSVSEGLLLMILLVLLIRFIYDAGRRLF